MTDKPTPTEEEIERAHEWLLSEGCLSNDFRRSFESLADLLATVREEGRAEGRLAVYRDPEDASLVHAYATGKAEGAREEREAVVRWLKRPVLSFAFEAEHIREDVIECIKRGEHRKGE